MSIPDWGSDTQISLPTVPSASQPVLVDLGGSGFGFTAGGICHTITADQLEELQQPTFAPLLDVTTNG